MRGHKLAELLAQELGIYVEPSRLNQYERRGVLSAPRRVGKYKNYTATDYDKVKKTVILSTLGVHLDDVRRYILGIGKEELEVEFRERMAKLSKVLAIAQDIWSVTN